MIISDTKGSLYQELAPELEKKGYKIKNINFLDLAKGSGYNPLDYIHYDEERDIYSEKDIRTLTYCLVKNLTKNDPYWDNAARQFLHCLISYVLEALPEEEHTMEFVVRLMNKAGTNELKILMEELGELKPQSTTALAYESIDRIAKAEKMFSSIIGVLSTHLDTLIFDDALKLYQKPDKIDFASLGKEKTAVFLTISDVDRSMDGLANAFMTQALQALCRSADLDYPEHYLPIPVRFYLDDFATNLYIPDFDKIISVIRSREIYVSVILQSITQLESLYGEARAKTIINNCDQQLYLGGQDVDTASFISKKADKSVSTILNMPLEDAWLFIRGRKPMFTQKYEAV